jgi:hypothetical protein
MLVRFPVKDSLWSLRSRHGARRGQERIVFRHNQVFSIHIFLICSFVVSILAPFLVSDGEFTLRVHPKRVQHVYEHRY